MQCAILITFHVASLSANSDVMIVCCHGLPGDKMGWNIVVNIICWSLCDCLIVNSCHVTLDLYICKYPTWIMHSLVAYLQASVGMHILGLSACVLTANPGMLDCLCAHDAFGDGQERQTDVLTMNVLVMTIPTFAFPAAWTARAAAPGLWPLSHPPIAWVIGALR